MMKSAYFGLLAHAWKSTAHTRQSSAHAWKSTAHTRQTTAHTRHAATHAWQSSLLAEQLVAFLALQALFAVEVGSLAHARKCPLQYVNVLGVCVLTVVLVFQLGL